MTKPSQHISGHSINAERLSLCKLTMLDGYTLLSIGEALSAHRSTTG